MMFTIQDNKRISEVEIDVISYMTLFCFNQLDLKYFGVI